MLVGLRCLPANHSRLSSKRGSQLTMVPASPPARSSSGSSSYLSAIDLTETASGNIDSIRQAGSSNTAPQSPHSALVSPSSSAATPSFSDRDESLNPFLQDQLTCHNKLFSHNLYMTNNSCVHACSSLQCCCRHFSVTCPQS